MPSQIPAMKFEQAAREHQNRLTKPQGALGRLEDVGCWFAARQGKVIPDVLQPHIAVFAADHGVTAEGISAFPSVVTAEMVKNFAQGGAAINVLAKQADASLVVVDVGVLLDVSAVEGVVNVKVQAGTANLRHEAAMTKAACQQAINVGRLQAQQAIAQGANVLIAGDMGIGNTTASACLICLLTDALVQDVVGRGTGIDDAMHQHKMDVVQQAIQRVTVKGAQKQDFLAEVGGLEIAAMCGYYLEAAESGVPVVIDGFIAAAAALVAQFMDENSVQWMLASHVSQENGHILALQKLGIEPFLDFKLRLGEGSGAALLLPLLQSAIALHRDMATFEHAGVSEKSE